MDRISGFGPDDPGSNPGKSIFQNSFILFYFYASRMGDTKKRRFFSAAFTLSGTIIGAGILGLPYVFSQPGFFVGLFWLIFLGIVMIFVNLCLGEVTLRTKQIHQLPGYAERYLGKKGKVIMVVSIIFGIYTALIAYMIGSGQSLSMLFTGGLEHSLLFGVFFWAAMTTLTRGGLKQLKRVEYWGVIGIILVIFIVFILLMPDIKLSNLTYFNLPDNFSFFAPFGVVLFALLGFHAIPEIRRELGRDKKLMRKSILLGVLAPIFLYTLISLAFVGVSGMELQEVSTLSFEGGVGNVLLILGIFTMLTSYFVLNFSLQDYFIYDLRKRKLSFFFVSILPLVLYLVAHFFQIFSFIFVLSVGGVITGGITGICVLLMNINSKKKGDRKPEYRVPLNWLVVSLLTLLFLWGIFSEAFNLF